jgi:RHS repeat-associated protein
MSVNVATGSLSLEYVDVGIGGRVNLTWGRTYTSLPINEPHTPLGLGWTNEYFATLAIKSDGFQFTLPSGTTNFDVDPVSVIERGGRAINYGAFAEIFRRGDRITIQRWSVDTGAAWRYCFPIGSVGQIQNLLSYEDASEQGLDLQWNEGLLVAVQQRLEKRLLLVDYTPAGMVESVTFGSPSGYRQVLSRYEYDTQSRLIAAFDAAQNADRYEYDQTGRLTRELVKDGGVFVYKYDLQGRCVRSSGLDRYDEKTIRYLEATGHSEVTNSYGKVTTYRYNSAGQVIEEMDPLGGKKIRSYDEHGRPTEKTDPNGATVRFEYDEQGNRSKIVDPLGNEFNYRFNEDHLVIETIAPNGDAWLRTYDVRNRMIASQDPLGGQWKVSYSDDGTEQSIIDPKGATKQYRYSDGTLTQVSDWVGNWRTLQYDDLGRLVKSVDPLGHSYVYAYNLLGNPTRIIMPDGSSVSMVYDVAGNPIEYIDAEGNAARFRFGPCRRLLEQQDRKGGIVRYGWGTEPELLVGVTNQVGETFTLTWDDAGRLIGKKSFDGVETAIHYDLAGQVIGVENGAGEEQWLKLDIMGREIHRVVSTGEELKFSYDCYGNVVEAATNDHVVKLTRDPLGRITHEKQDDEWVRIDYDEVGNWSRIASSLDDEIVCKYDGNNALQGLAFNRRNVFGFSRDANGRETLRSLPGGETLLHTYNDRGSVESQTITRRRFAGSHIQELMRRDYTYDVRNLLQSVRQTDHQLITYSYDADEALIGYLQNGGEERFELDPTNNVTRVEIETRDSQSVVKRVYGPGNRLLQSGDTRYEYDGDGRLVRKCEAVSTSSPRVWLYKWNAMGQLVSLTTPEGGEWRYSYDAFGRRMGKVGPTQAIRYVWNKHMLLHEIGNKGTRPATYVFEPGTFRPLAQVREGKWQTIVCDSSGTPKELLNEAGRIVPVSRTSWGQSISKGSRQSYCPIGFEGQFFDNEGGLYYNRFRYYDPSIGRYISQDPKSIRGGLNLYAYCHNPLQNVDPLGLDSTALDRALGGAPKDGQQAHHIIPEGEMTKYPNLENAITPLGYDRDHAKNGILLPASDTEAQARNIPSHRGSHPGYNAQVGARVGDIDRRLANGLITPQEAFDELRALQDEYRKKIEQNDPSLPRSAKFPCKLG